MRLLILSLLFALLSLAVNAQSYGYSGASVHSSVTVAEGDTIALPFGGGAFAPVVGTPPSFDGGKGLIGSMGLMDFLSLRLGCMVTPYDEQASSQVQFFIRPTDNSFQTPLGSPVSIFRGDSVFIKEELTFFAGNYEAGAELIVVGIEGKTNIWGADLLLSQLIDVSQSSQVTEYVVHTTPDTVFNSTSWSNLTSTEKTLEAGLYLMEASGRWTAGAVGDISLGWYSPDDSGIDLFSWSRDHDNVSGNDRSLTQAENGNGTLNTWKRFYFRGIVQLSSQTVIGMRMRQRGLDLEPTILGETVIEWTKVE